MLRAGQTRLTASRLAIDELQARDGSIAAKPVDPLDYLRGQVLQLKSQCRRGANNQCAVPPAATGKGDSDWIALVCQGRPDEFCPTGHQCGIQETPAAEGAAGQVAERTGQPNHALMPFLSRSGCPTPARWPGRFPVALVHHGDLPTLSLAAVPCRAIPGGVRHYPYMVPAMVRNRHSQDRHQQKPDGAPSDGDIAGTEVASALLAWYDRHRRVLPWRAAPGERPDPYHVWLSEIMLQQTTVATVGPYFARFLERWPDIDALARAALDDVLHAWQGLGYYARARNLHRCAQAVSNEHGGRFPDHEEELRELPGIGSYTAAAIASIAFDRPATVVDGNVERVISRLFRLETPLPDVKKEIAEKAGRLTPQSRPGDHAQAMMDLGATICVPRKPKCVLCPLQSHCLGKDIADRLPAKRPKPERPTRYGFAFWLVRCDGAILLRRRPEKGLLGGLMEVPGTDWKERHPDTDERDDAAPVAIDWTTLPGQVRHTFTHFHLVLTVLVGRDPSGEAEGVWCLPDRLGEHALPTLMRKVVRHALAHVGRD